MKIMLIDSLPVEVAVGYIGDNVIYRPDLGFKSASILMDALAASSIRAVITHVGGRLGRIETLPHGCLRDVVVIEIDENLSATYDDGTRFRNGLSVTTVHSHDIGDAYRHSLEVLERYSIERIVYDCPNPAVESLLPGRDVAVIGAGVVNLVTAYRLCQEGYQVRVFDASPDPATDAHWRHFGCSRGGDDARMFTLSEMDNYNDRLPSENMNTLFNRDVESFGWGAAKLGSLGSDELSWIADYETLPIWLADKYNEDIFGFSRSSRLAWEEWIRNDPELFGNCELRKDILRIYSHREGLAKAVERQNRIGATISILTPEKVAEYQPALADAVSQGRIAGGIVVIGFTVNAHKFIACLISRMLVGGVQFNWNRRADAISRNADGTVEGVKFGETVVVASNYVVSPGAYSQKFLQGTKSEGRIHGVLGAWLRIPNLVPQLHNSLKLARMGHVTEDANITVATDVNGEPIIIIGSGYGHTGIDPLNVDDGLLRRMYDGLIDTAKLFFPEAYKVAADMGMIESSLKYCVRPWTSNGLGIFEMIMTSSGGRFIITGGHNTGGFAQSPTIADAVVDGLSARRHPMHILYHPDRASSFLERSRLGDLRGKAELERHLRSPAATVNQLSSVRENLQSVSRVLTSDNRHLHSPGLPLPQAPLQ